MKKLKIFKQDVLTIANRIIISKDSFIQIRNVTRIWHGKPDIDIPVFKLLLSFGGSIAVMMNMSSSFGLFLMLGVFGAVGYYIYLFNNYTLNFELSSGQVYAFTSLNKEFLIESYHKIKGLMMDKELSKEKYEINFHSCKIDIVKGDHNIVSTGDHNTITKGDQNIVGDHNTVAKGDHNIIGDHNVSGTNHSVGDDNSKHVDKSDHHENNVSIQKSFNSNVEFNYELMSKELKALLDVPEIRSNIHDIEVIQEAQKYVEEKDEKKLKTTLKKLSKKTYQIIEGSSTFITVGSFLADLIFNKG